MKTKLNILCVLVLLALSYSIVTTGYYFLLGAQAGIASVDSQQEMERMSNLKYISVIPDNLMAEEKCLFPDSILNAKSGTYVPVAYSNLLVSVHAPQSVASALVVGLSGFVLVGLGIWAFVLFIRLIVDVNRSNIFNWKNVRRLRKLGIALLLLFGLSLLSDYLQFCNVKEVFAIQHYSLDMSEMVDITNLILGLSVLIVGEVFAVGLRMQEEQDLTI